MISDTSRFAEDTLTRFSCLILSAAGARESDAGIVARHLVGANLVGHDSHGVGMLPAYVAHAKKGLVALDAEPDWQDGIGDL